MIGQCDICGKKLYLKETLTCKNCGKEVCEGHESEQYESFSVSTEKSVFSSNMYNYPDGESVSKDEFQCYHCRTGKTSTNTEKPKSFFTTKKGIAISVIVIKILSVTVFYVYESINKEVYMEMEGFSGEKTSDDFEVQETAEIELAEFDPIGDDFEMTVQIYNSNTDEQIEELEVSSRTTSRAGTRYYFIGDTTITPGEYYITVDNDSGNYEIEVVEE